MNIDTFDWTAETLKISYNIIYYIRKIKIYRFFRQFDIIWDANIWVTQQYEQMKLKCLLFSKISFIYDNLKEKSKCM